MTRNKYVYALIITSLLGLGVLSFQLYDTRMTNIHQEALLEVSQLQVEILTLRYERMAMFAAYLKAENEKLKEQRDKSTPLKKELHQNVQDI